MAQDKGAGERGSSFYTIHNSYYLYNKVGSGSFGVVRRARNLDTDEEVAIKQIKCAASETGMTRRVLREVRVLHCLNHPNILSLLDVYFEEDMSYFITELCEIDLFNLTYIQRDRYKDLKRQDFAWIMKQITEGVEYMHIKHITHRDIKPSNILINTNMVAKICDFGLARQVSTPGLHQVPDDQEEEEKGMMCELPMTPYVVTRWYRAPEVLCTDGNYDCSQDIWALACTFGEFITRAPMFPGDCSMDQIRRIVRGLGKPSDSDLDYDGILDDAKKWFQSLSPTPGKGLIQLLSPSIFTEHTATQTGFIQLMRAMLCFNPRHRISCTTALKLPFFQERNVPKVELLRRLRVLKECARQEEDIVCNLEDIELCKEDPICLTQMLVRECESASASMHCPKKGKDSPVEENKYSTFSAADSPLTTNETSASDITNSPVCEVEEDESIYFYKSPVDDSLSKKLDVPETDQGAETDSPGSITDDSINLYHEVTDGCAPGIKLMTTPISAIDGSVVVGPNLLKKKQKKSKPSNSLLERFTKGFGTLIKFNTDDVNDTKESLYKLDGLKKKN